MGFRSSLYFFQGFLNGIELTNFEFFRFFCAAKGCDVQNTTKDRNRVRNKVLPNLSYSFPLREDHSGLLCNRHYQQSGRSVKSNTNPKKKDWTKATNAMSTVSDTNL